MTNIVTYGGFIEVVNSEHYEFYYECTKEKFSTVDQFVNWAVNKLKTILSNDHFEIDESELNYFTNGLCTYNEGRRSYATARLKAQQSSWG